MKKIITILQDKQLLTPPPGVTLKQILLFITAIVLVASTSSLIWGKLTTLFLWLLILTINLYLRNKKDRLIQERFDEIDQRDMDFHEECDAHFEQLNNVISKSNK